jgi:hypothetical protein
MTDEHAATVLREKFAKADLRRERMMKAAWFCVGMAVLTLIVWGIARAVDMGQI